MATRQNFGNPGPPDMGNQHRRKQHLEQDDSHCEQIPPAIAWPADCPGRGQMPVRYPNRGIKVVLRTLLCWNIADHLISFCPSQRGHE